MLHLELCVKPLDLLDYLKKWEKFQNGFTSTLHALVEGPTGLITRARDEDPRLHSTVGTGHRRNAGSSRMPAAYGRHGGCAPMNSNRRDEPAVAILGREGETVVAPLDEHREGIWEFFWGFQTHDGDSLGLKIIQLIRRIPTRFSWNSSEENSIN
jgi:hypothetical protein